MQPAQVLTCAANTVHIVLVVVGHYVVDHQLQVLDIQPPGRNRGGDQHSAHICLEVLDGALPVQLVFASVQ